MHWPSCRLSSRDFPVIVTRLALVHVSSRTCIFSAETAMQKTNSMVASRDLIQPRWQQDFPAWPPRSTRRFGCTSTGGRCSTRPGPQAPSWTESCRAYRSARRCSRCGGRADGSATQFTAPAGALSSPSATPAPCARRWRVAVWLTAGEPFWELEWKIPIFYGREVRKTPNTS